MECKKCKRPLSAGSKAKLCENCKGKRAQNTKDVGKGILTVGGAVLSIVVLIGTKGKVNPKG